MKKLLTKAIILNRTEYGEADRIVVALSPDYGKLRLIVKGARKVKSKLAGGIELFSVSELSFIEGKGAIGTLISARLVKHYGQIVSDLERVQVGYELLRLINRATEDQPEAAYFDLLEQVLEALDKRDVALGLISSWFKAQIIKLAGHTPNLNTDTLGHKLAAEAKYNFDLEAMAFSPNEKEVWGSSQVKSLRLIFSQANPSQLAQINGLDEQLSLLHPLIQAMLVSFVPV